ncbi:MAG: DNRLRE domain-containing protein, partial [Anaerolineae bacterium]
ELVQLLNVFYHRWKGDGGTATPTATRTPSTPTPTATSTPTGTWPPSTPTATRTATPTPTGTRPAGQQTMTFQDGVWPNASYAGTADVILANDAESNANLGGAENLETFFGEGQEHRRSLIRWDLSALPGDATINGATVELYRFDGEAANAMRIALYRLTRDWMEGTGNDFWPDSSYIPDGATWTLASPGTAWTTPGGDFDTTMVGQITLPAGMGNGWVSLDATTAVRAWIEQGVPNYGLLLRPHSGDYTYHYYYSRNHSVPNLRPRLVVTYTVGVVTATPTATSALPTSTPTRTPTPTRTAIPPTSTPTRTGAPPTYGFVYLPLIMKSWSAPLPTPTATPTTVIPSGLIQPADLVYQGAFRLPGGDTPPQTFAYGGNAMTFNPDGDPANTDPYPGSLFVMGHDRMAYGDLPDGNQVAEVSIPVPAIADNPADLPQETFIQGFHNVAAGYFTQLDEIPKVGMQYLNHPATGPKIHLAWGQHLQPPDVPSHAWFNPTLETPDLQGVWFIGYQDLYSTNGYMFDIPTSWADAHAESRYLATGRMRDGGQGGMGPALFAYRPWLPDGSPPVSGTHLAETTLLLYENAYTTEEIIRCLNGYQHPDEWEGGAWITTPSGRQAVLFAGTKSNGTKYWYGYLHPDGSEYPCVDAAVTDYVTCRMADGRPCPAEDFTGCCDENEGTCITYRGWWTTHFDAQFILYDPADLARVADGEIESWKPQPYASLDIDEHLYLDPPVWERVSLGWGDQRRYRIGDVAYDRENALLYVLELYADGAKPVVHVWRVEG